MENDKTFLCFTHDLRDKPCLGFELHNNVDAQHPTTELFLVRKGQKIFAYLNSCPHTGVNLHWQPDDFLDLDDQFIQCSVHGALFRIEDGLCLHGPCLGASLTGIDICIDEGKVYLLVSRPPARTSA